MHYQNPTTHGGNGDSIYNLIPIFAQFNLKLVISTG